MPCKALCHEWLVLEETAYVDHSANRKKATRHGLYNFDGTSL